MEAGIRHPLPLNCGKGSTDLMPVDATGKVRPDEGKVGIFPLTNRAGVRTTAEGDRVGLRLSKTASQGKFWASYRI